MPFKERFCDTLESYNAQGNPEMDGIDIAMDFFNALEDARYSEFKNETLNDIEKGIMDQPATLSEMYALAQSHLTSDRGHARDGTRGTAFATTHDKRGRRRAKKETSDDEEEASEWMKRQECYKCHQYGHY